MTEWRKDGRTEWRKGVTLYAPAILWRGHKKPERKTRQWKRRYRWKRYRSMPRRNFRHFPPSSGRMTPNRVVLCRHREHGDSNKRWRQRWFEPLQETGVKKMINCNMSSEFISLWFASVYGATSSIPKLRFTITKSKRTVTQQDVPLDNVTSGRPSATVEVTISVREYVENYQK